MKGRSRYRIEFSRISRALSIYTYELASWTINENVSGTALPCLAWKLHLMLLLLITSVDTTGTEGCISKVGGIKWLSQFKSPTYSHTKLHPVSNTSAKGDAIRSRGKTCSIYPS